MRYQLLACDYDGTIARHGVVDETTVEALRKVTRSGRKLALVTGRELRDLLRVFASIEVFDWVVAENGGTIYNPSTREETPLVPEPSAALVSLLEQRGVSPLSIGRTIIATWEPNEKIVLEAIRDLGLELGVTFNKGAVMVLPASVNKRSGFETLLGRIGLSPHNCVGIGDAENDHAFLGVCEFSAAVANALPALKASVDWVANSDHGAGVRELIEQLIDNDLSAAGLQPKRNAITLGSFDDGADFSMPAVGPVGLVAGSSGSGKTTVARSWLEQLAQRDYQLCIIDPEGDYESFSSAIVVGTAEHAPEIEQVSSVLSQPKAHAVVNLLGVPFSSRPHFFMDLLAFLHRSRATTGRPHWIAVDEAHHVLDSQFEPMTLALPSELESFLFITVSPERLHASLLARLDFAILVGSAGASALGALAESIDIASPELATEGGEDSSFLYWERRSNRGRRFNLTVDASTHRRHRRKYAKGELGPDKSFYFRGPTGKLNLRAQNLIAFIDLGLGVDDETWTFHLRAGDFSSWIRRAIKDEELARGVAEIEANENLSPEESRSRIRGLIESVYTIPA